MMKRLDDVKIHYDWALTHNMNWGLVMADHYDLYSGPLVKFSYEGAALPMVCHPDQRFAAPGRKGGYRWVPACMLNPMDQVFFVKAEVKQKENIVLSRVTQYDVVWVEREMLFTVTVADELSFIAHDLIAHRNPEGYRAAAHNKAVNALVDAAGHNGHEIVTPGKIF